MGYRVRQTLWAATLLAAAGLGGCTDAITVWPVAAGAQGTASVDVPAVAGHWRMTGEGPDGPTLEIGHVPGEHSTCRGGMVTYKESGNVTELGDQTCFIDLDGNLVAEIRSVAPMADFFRQYLVRIEPDRIEVCTGLTVWAVLAAMAEDQPVGYSFDTIEHTVREQESGDLMVIIARPEPMREFLATALPEMAAACDQNHNDLGWAAFERYDPDAEPAAAE
jgi:hypothetical protein